MAQRFILNGTSYHGAGAIQEIATEVKSRGFKKAFVCSDPDLIKFNVTSKVTDVLAKEGLEYEIEVDGSCNQATYEKLMAAGADVFIVGTSGLFNHAENIDEAWRIMTAQILAAKSEVQPHAKTA